MEGHTLGICGTADDVGEFGLEAGVSSAVLARRLVASGAQRQHTLQRRVGPQTLTLMDGQRCGVVYQESSILKERRETAGSMIKERRTLLALNKLDSQEYIPPPFGRN